MGWVFKNVGADSLHIREMTRLNKNRVRGHLGCCLSIEAFEPVLKRAATLGIKIVPERARK